MPHTKTGVYAASVTPITSNLEADPELLYLHCKELIEAGGAGIVLMGTTGEANSFSTRQRKEVLDGLLARGFPSDQLILGVGCCSLDETVHLSNHALDQGVTGLLVMPPFYYRQITEEGLFRYYATLAQHLGSSADIYLYHFPRMSGIDMTPAFIQRLKEAFPDQISGIKDSGGDLSHMREILELIPGFGLFTGNETFLLDVLELGGAGCITATVNVNIDIAASVYRGWKSGGVSLEATQQMISNRRAFDGYPYCPSIKGVLAAWSGNVSWNRLLPPQEPLPEDELKIVLDHLDGVRAN